MIKTKLFEWAEREGYSVDELVSMTGYSKRHIYRMRKGEYPITESFQAKIILRLGDWARSLFLPEMTPGSAKTEIHGVLSDNDATN